MSTIMLIIVTVAFVAMLTVNILFARGKKRCVNTLFVMCMITTFVFAAVAAATGVFAAFDAISTDAVAKAAEAAVTDASGYFIVSALAACFAACFASVVAAARSTRNHVLMSVGFYACMGVSVYMFLIGSSFVF